MDLFVIVIIYGNVEGLLSLSVLLIVSFQDLIMVISVGLILPSFDRVILILKPWIRTFILPYIILGRVIDY